MSHENRADGHAHYGCGDYDTREWFHRQWKIWPERADQRFTTNLSFHHGGVLAYRAEYNRDPEMSREFKSNVEWMDEQEPVE